jgi:uncharacterized membrane protein YfcA
MKMDWMLTLGWSQALLLVAVGILVSFFNSVAGGGSMVSLPLLLALGLSGSEANGTNRVGVFLGTVGSVTGFRGKGFFPKSSLIPVLPLAMLGGLLGAWAGVQLPDTWFRPILAVVLITICFALWRQKERPPEGDPTQLGPISRSPLALAGYFLVGFYGGFLQAGVGLLMMALFSRVSTWGWVRINALKVVNTLGFITLSLGVYGLTGNVRWDMAVWLCLGNLLGGYLGSWMQIRQGDRWVKGLLGWVGIAMAGKLIWDSREFFF